MIGDRAFVTCYSGYGLDQSAPGEMKDLMRHLICVDAGDGQKLWQRDIPAVLPEDPYSGVGVTAHGYASHTPVTDGTNVYAFFGKSGVHAFDLDGNPLWQTDVGRESDPTRWGSSSSPIIHGDSVIVTASAESQSIVCLDRSTGKELWRQEAKGLDGMWGTPTLVTIDDSRTDLVMCVAKEMWGIDPDSGKLRWYAEATDAEGAYSSVITNGDSVYAFTGRGGGSVAITAGGSGDVTDSNTLWTGTETASFGSPVAHGSKLYLLARGVLTVVDRQSGEKLQQLRLEGAEKTGGRFGSLDYPSPIVVGDRLFALNGSGQMFVFDLSGEEAVQTAVNKVTADKESFGGSPAVSQGRLLLRSSDHLYCVTDKGESVAPSSETVAAKADADRQPESTSGGRYAGVRAGGGREAGERAGGGREGGGRGPGASGGGGNWNPMSLFDNQDANQDGKLTEAELAGSRMADRIKPLDKDADGVITKEEFRQGMSTMFSRGGRGSRPGGGSRRGGEDSRPERPQRPEMATQS